MEAWKHGRGGNSNLNDLNGNCFLYLLKQNITKTGKTNKEQRRGEKEAWKHGNTEEMATETLMIKIKTVYFTYLKKGKKEKKTGIIIKIRGKRGCVEILKHGRVGNKHLDD